jgi:hypothetical protein
MPWLQWEDRGWPVGCAGSASGHWDRAVASILFRLYDMPRNARRSMLLPQGWRHLLRAALRRVGQTPLCCLWRSKMIFTCDSANCPLWHRALKVTHRTVTRRIKSPSEGVFTNNGWISNNFKPMKRFLLAMTQITQTDRALNVSTPNSNPTILESPWGSYHQKLRNFEYFSNQWSQFTCDIANNAVWHRVLNGNTPNSNQKVWRVPWVFTRKWPDFKYFSNQWSDFFTFIAQITQFDPAHGS